MIDATPPRCTYVTNQASGDTCNTYTMLYYVYARVGTSRILLAPLPRCGKHVGRTVEFYAQNVYPNYLDRVEGPWRDE